MNTSQKIATILLKGGIAPLTEIAPQLLLSPAAALPLSAWHSPPYGDCSAITPIPRCGRPYAIVFIKTLPATSHSRENKRRFNFAAKIQPPRNAALIHTPPISKPGILNPLRKRKAVYLILRRAQTNKRPVKLGSRVLLWYITNLINIHLLTAIIRNHKGDRRIARQSP